MISVSWFPRELSSPSERVVYRVRDFTELVSLLGPPKPYRAKLGIPMFSPAEWPPGTKKTKEFVQRVHFGVLDYDDVPEDDLAGLLARVDVPHLFVSSWHHGDPYKTQLALNNLKKTGALSAARPKTAKDAFLAAWGNSSSEVPKLVRGRLLVPFSRPVEVAEWPRFWRVFIQRFTFGLARPDTSCSDSSRCFFYPAHPPEPPKPPIYLDASH